MEGLGGPLTRKRKETEKRKNGERKRKNRERERKSDMWERWVRINSR